MLFLPFDYRRKRISHILTNTPYKYTLYTQRHSSEPGHSSGQCPRRLSEVLVQGPPLHDKSSRRPSDGLTLMLRRAHANLWECGRGELYLPLGHLCSLLLVRCCTEHALTRHLNSSLVVLYLVQSWQSGAWAEREEACCELPSVSARLPRFVDAI